MSDHSVINSCATPQSQIRQSGNAAMRQCANPPLRESAAARIRRCANPPLR
jgi:hypothetical protein